MAGSDVSFANAWVQFGLKAKLLNETFDFGSANTPNVAGMIDALATALDGEYVADGLSDAETFRAQLAALVTRPRLAASLRPYLREIARAANVDAGADDDATLLARIRQYMQDNSQSINSRGMTLGSPSASGSPTFDGTFYRCTVDKDGNTLENVFPEAKEARVIADNTSGTSKHAEVWRIKSTADTSKDGLDLVGSGLSVEVTTINESTGRLLKNPSFDQNGASSDGATPSSTTSITNWTLGTPGNFLLRNTTALTYSSYPGAPTTQWALEFEADDAINQVINSQNAGRQAFARDVPYVCLVRYMRRSSATGTLTLACGSASANATIGSATNDQWATLAITVGANSWFDSFNETDLDIRISTSSLATGTVIVDGCILAPMVRLPGGIDGTFYAIVKGETGALVDDTYTWTDSEGGTLAVNSYLLWRAYGADGWLPVDNSGTETIADPS